MEKGSDIRKRKELNLKGILLDLIPGGHSGAREERAESRDRTKVKL